MRQKLPRKMMGHLYPMAEAGNAMRDLLDRKVTGKAVLVP